jgi:hypothetical protein
MNNSVSYLAYPDVKSAFDRVLMTTRGVRVKFSKHGEAVRFASRCNYFRVLDRKENLKIYKDMETHSLFGRSVYDALRISIRGDEVHIVPIALDEGAVSDL